MSTDVRPLPEENILRTRLAALRRRMRLVITTRGFGITLAIILLGAMGAGYLDWRFHLPGFIRALMLVLILAGTVIDAYRYLIRPLSRRDDDLSLALRVEDHYPNLNDSLASTVEFLNRPKPPPGESGVVRREAVRRALSRAVNCDFNRVVDTRGLRWVAFAVVLAIAGAGVLAFLFPHDAATAMARLAAPFGTAEWPRLTQIEFDPPRTRIGLNETFELNGQVKGVIPDKAIVVYRFENLPERRDTIQLSPLTPGGNWAPLSVHWKPDERHSPFKVQVFANDAVSEEFTVQVLPPPRLAALDGEPTPQLRLFIPPYTDQPSPQVLTGTGSVEAIAGTVVLLRAAADRPLARAWLEPTSGAVISNVSAMLEDDPSRFNIRFVPLGSGWYNLHIEDLTGLQSQTTYEVHIHPDPAPVVKLERPSEKHDILSVLPTAVLSLNIIAQDAPPPGLTVGALRSVFLRYRTQEKEAPRTLFYYNHATAAEKLFAPLAGPGILARSPRLRPTRLDVEMPLPIAQFKHANGAPLRPGDVLILQACADDFDDITPNKAPGVSEEVRLTIVDAGGFEQAVTREQKLVQDVLAEQRDKEHAAVQQITQAEKRIKDGENLTTPDLETLTQNEQVQREVRDRFGPNPDQLRGQLRRMEESLKQNGMQHSALRDRLRQVERELERLAENDLIQAEQQLASARQQAEKSALQADKARAAKRQADEMQERADKLNTEANDKEAAAGMPQNADKRDDLLAEAKKAREEEKRLEKEIEALKRETEKAEQEAGRLLDNTHTREAVTAARRRTEEVEKTLNDLLARLEPSRAIAEIKGEARDLLDLQRQLEARVEALERQPAFGKKPEEMTPQERDELKAVAEAQKELEDRTAALLERIRKEAELRKQTEPELAKKLQEAAKQAAKENVLGQMQEARTKLGANKLEEVRQSQKGSGAGLEALARNLGRQNEMEQEQLVKKLKEAEKQLEKIREEAEELRRRKQDLEEGKGNLTPEQRQDELKRLARREEELRKQTQELAKRLSREGRADRARQALEKAANNPDEMLERLNEAERELHRAEQREQEVLEREQLARILDVIERLRDRQAALNAEAERVQSEAKRDGKWTRPLGSSLLELREGQNGLKTETEDIIPKELTNTPVFARMVQRSAEAMGQAAGRAEKLVQEGKTNKIAVESLPDAELAKHQKEALRRLEVVIEAVKSQMDAPPPPAAKPPPTPAGAEQPEPESSPPPQTGLPPLAQLKLLKLLQKDVNHRALAFKKDHLDLNKLSETEAAEYNSIIRDQQDVRELLGEMSRPAGEGPDDKGAEPKRPEGERK